MVDRHKLRDPRQLSPEELGEILNELNVKIEQAQDEANSLENQTEKKKREVTSLREQARRILHERCAWLGISEH